MQLYVQVLLSTVEVGDVATVEEFKLLCEKMADSRNFKFCPGIPPVEYEQCRDVIRYNPKMCESSRYLSGVSSP